MCKREYSLYDFLMDKIHETKAKDPVYVDLYKAGLRANKDPKVFDM